ELDIVGIRGREILQVLAVAVRVAAVALDDLLVERGLLGIGKVVVISIAHRFLLCSPAVMSYRSRVRRHEPRVARCTPGAEGVDNRRRLRRGARGTQPREYSGNRARRKPRTRGFPVPVSSLGNHPRKEHVMITQVTASKLIDAPVRRVYDQWTQFEEFPHFMSAVRSVQQLDDTHTRWDVEIGGVRR